MKKLLFILTLFLSFVAAAQPGPVNKYNTRVRYWLEMADSLQGFPKDTFNLRTTWAINNGWNNYAWIASKGDSSYMWSVAQQKWIQTTSKSQLASTVTIISDSSIQICDGNNVCDTFISNLSPPVVTNVTTINDSTLLICINGSCDTIITHITVNPPITSTTILNDSTLIICNINGCDTFVIHSTVNPPITTTTIFNDSTIIVCNTNGCDTFVVTTINPPITTVTVLNDTTIIVCNNVTCDTLVIHPPINSTTILNDSTIIVCNNFGCDTLVIHPPIINSTVLNDSTIIICGTNSCDTIVLHSSITNVTIINDTTVQVCGSNILGAEEITNGGFVGNANGWQLGSLWAYGTNNIVHSFGSAQPTAQAGTLVEGGTYVVSANIGGATGTLDVKLDAGTTHTYAGGAGLITFTGTWNNANNYAIVFTPSTNFDGSVTNVSVRRVLPNCDTLQVPPTLFIPTDTFYVKNTLYSTGVGVTNHDTVYSSRAGRFDSGHLSMEDWRYFNHKADSLYSHSSAAGIDSFLYNNGDATGVFWYANDVNANGLISGGQVLPSGTPYVFNITSAVYRINGIRYTSPPTQVTIPTADPSLPRTDRFVVDTSGNATVIIGTAANPNLAPSFDVAWQLSLTTVDLPAANPPQIVDSLIWNENVLPEWIPVTNVGTTTNANNTVNPWLGTKSIDVTNINNADIIKFTHTTTFNLTPFVVANGSLTGFILLKAPMPSTAALRGTWLNAGTFVSPATVIPIDRNNTTSYQGFSVPLSAFALAGNTVTDFWITYTNTTATNYAGFYLDDINLQSGIQPPVSAANALILVSRRPGTDSVMGTYQNGTVSYQFKDSSGGARQTLQQTFNTEVGGSVLTKVDSIIAGSNTIRMFGTGGGLGSVLNVTNSGGTGITVSGTFNGINTSGSAGPGITATSSASNGVTGISTAGQAGGSFQTSTSSTNTVVSALSVQRVSTGTPANGIGVAINMTVQTVTGGTPLANQIVSKWTDATNATRTSQFIITGVNSAVTADLFTLSGSGALQLNKYGIGTFTGTATHSLLVDASGNVIEGTAGSGAGGLQTLQQTFNTEVGGSVLTKNDSILTGANHLFITGSDALYTILADNTSTGSAIKGTSVGGNAVFGVSSTGVGGAFNGTGNSATAALQSFKGTNGGITALFTTSGSANLNTIETAVKIVRATTGVPANGIGESLDFNNPTISSINGDLSNQIISKWTDATTATRISQLDITGVNSAATGTIASFYGSGVVGIGRSSAFGATRLDVIDNSVSGITPMINFSSTSGNGFIVEVTGTGNSLPLAVTADGANQTAVSISSSGTGAKGISVDASGTTGTSLFASTSSLTGTPINVYSIPTSTGSIANGIFIDRATTGTPVNGMGINIEFRLKAGATNLYEANQIISKWTDATEGTRTSQLSITGVNSAVTQTLVTIDGDGTSTFLGPSSPPNTVRAINTINTAVKGETTSGIAVFGAASSSGTGVVGISSSGTGGTFQSNSSIAIIASGTLGGQFTSFDGTNVNTVIPIITVNRSTSATPAADGVGGSIDFHTYTDNVTNQLSNQIISKWTTAANATRTSQLSITGVNSAATVTSLIIDARGFTQGQPISATAASALTPAESMSVFVNSTNGTFTSIGYWDYENGAWHKR